MPVAVGTVSPFENDMPYIPRHSKNYAVCFVVSEPQVEGKGKKDGNATSAIAPLQNPDHVMFKTGRTSLAPNSCYIYVKFQAIMNIDDQE